MWRIAVCWEENWFLGNRLMATLHILFFLLKFYFCLFALHFKKFKDWEKGRKKCQIILVSFQILNTFIRPPCRKLIFLTTYKSSDFTTCSTSVLFLFGDQVFMSSWSLPSYDSSSVFLCLSWLLNTVQFLCKMYSVWVCLMFPPDKIQEVCLGKNIKESVLCSSQCIVSGGTWCQYVLLLVILLLIT